MGRLIDKDKLLAELDAKSTNPNYRLNMRVIKAMIKRQQEQESVIDKAIVEIGDAISFFTLENGDIAYGLKVALDIIDKLTREAKNELT